VTLPSDENGLILDELEAVLQKRPKFIYILPNFQNPSGRTLSLERRQYLVEATTRYGIPIVEDDAYVRLRFEGESLPSLQLLASRAQKESEYKEHVIHMGTFSKILSPGLRLGWIIAPTPLISKLVQAKQGTDLHTPTFTQMIAYEMAREGFLEEHIPLIREVYRKRRDTMLAALSEHFPAHITWTRPQGGMFLWATLPEGTDSVKILEEAVQQKVAFVPGTAFHPCGGGENTMRLNFSNASPEKIREGIARLGQVLARQKSAVR
jgi:2-aminoadipate transaminase